MLHVFLRLVILFSECIIALTIIYYEGLPNWPYIYVRLSFFGMNCISNHCFFNEWLPMWPSVLVHLSFSEWIIGPIITYYEGLAMWHAYFRTNLALTIIDHEALPKGIYVCVRFTFFGIMCSSNNWVSSELIVSLTMVYYEWLPMWPYVIARHSSSEWIAATTKRHRMQSYFFRFTWVRIVYKVDDHI